MAPTMRTHRFLAAALLCLPLAALGQAAAPAKPAMPSNHPPIGAGQGAKAPPSPWAEMAEYTLTVKVPPKGDTGTWKFHTYADPGDVVIDLDTPAAKGRTKGSIMLVGGNAIAAKGFALEPGFELDPLDIAVVNLKILTQLLDKAAPGGPATLKGKKAVNAREETMPILVSTPSANAKLNAPWTLKGTVERLDAGNVAFQLEVEVARADKPAERERWTFTGKAGGTSKGRVLEDTMGLAGWTAYRIGPAKGAKQTHTSLQFAATKLAGPYATLKDLRAALN